MTIQSKESQVEWRFVAVSIDRRRDIAISNWRMFCPQIEGVASFHLSRRAELIGDS